MAVFTTLLRLKNHHLAKLTNRGRAVNFERLLGEAAKDDRDSMVAKTYLTSETGKVYTMLAHASGRFE